MLELFRFARKYLQPLVDFAAQSRRRTEKKRNKKFTQRSTVNPKNFNSPVSFALDLATDRLAQIVQLDRLLPAGHDAGVRLLQRREDRHDAVLVDGQRTLHHRELLPQEGHLVLEVVLLLALVLGVLDGADQLLQFFPEAFAVGGVGRELVGSRCGKTERNNAGLLSNLSILDLSTCLPSSDAKERQLWSRFFFVQSKFLILGFKKFWRGLQIIEYDLCFEIPIFFTF